MRSSLAWVALTWVVVLACGGDDGDGGDDQTSGVERNTLLSSLTDAQAQALCRFDERVYKESLVDEEHYCAAYGANGASAAAECEQSRLYCLSAGSYDDDVGEDWECETAEPEDFVADGSDCDATVGHYELCATRRAEERVRFMESASCDDEGWFSGPYEPPPCAVLEPCDSASR